MHPIWLCLDCKGVAYGWANGPCIYCNSSRVVGTQAVPTVRERVSQNRLVFFNIQQWCQLEVEAILAGRSPRELLAEREQAEVVLIRPEPVRHGQLVVLKTES